jgi:hypothetical protein
VVFILWHLSRTLDFAILVVFKEFIYNKKSNKFCHFFMKLGVFL